MAPNDYFEHDTPLTRHTVARAAALNAIFTAIEGGFDLLPDFDRINEGRSTYAEDTGAANAYLVTLPETLLAYTEGLSLTMQAVNANTGASTINVDGVGAKAIKRFDGSALEANDILAGMLVPMTYNGTEFRLTGVHGATEALAEAASTAADEAEASAIAAAASAAAAAALVAPIADQRLFGNVSGGAAVPTALTQAQIRTFLGQSADGTSVVTAANFAAIRALLDLEAGTDFYSIAATNAAIATAVAGLYDIQDTPIDCSANPNYPAAEKGDVYFISVAGKIGGASGETVQAGDSIVAILDNAGGTQAGVGSSWVIVQGNVAFTAAGLAVATAATEAAQRVALGLDQDGFEMVIDGGGATITTGIKACQIGPMPYAGTITMVTALADQSGSIVVDIWKDTYANYPPDNADSITAAAPVTISAATKSQDSTLTGWTVAFAAGDILRPNVDSCTSITFCTIMFKFTKG